MEQPGFHPYGRTEGHARGLLILLTALLALGCSACSSTESQPYSSEETIPVQLPDGSTIEAEPAVTPEQITGGLMFRDHLPPDRGMLFFFRDEQPRSFFMFQTLIPLDIIWLDRQRRIVYISADTPPCPSPNPGQCPTYGEETPAQYVLELAAGQAAAHGLQVGDQLVF